MPRKSASASAAARCERLEPRRLLAVQVTDSSTPTNLVDFNGTLFFNATDGVNGRELSKSDGTGAGTVMVKDIVPGGVGSNPGNLHIVGNTLYFLAHNEFLHRQLWKTDGTAAGTVLVSDLFTLTQHQVSESDEVASLDGTLYIPVRDFDNYSALIKSDGTAAGTTIVREFDETSFTNLEIMGVIDSTLILSVHEPVSGRELWKSDGTTAGTVLVKDIRAGGEGSGVGIFDRSLVTLNGSLYFRASDGIAGTEIWKTDGTAAGTTLVKDINPGSADSDPGSFVTLGGFVYFSATEPEHGREMWRTDGTTAGTTLFVDIEPGPADSSVAPGAFRTEVAGSVMYFAVGAQLWKSDGTVAGTAVVPGTENLVSGPVWIKAIGDTVYFIASDGNEFNSPIPNPHGNEFWKSDGTQAGTMMIADIHPGPDNGALTSSAQIVSINGTLFFPATNGTDGEELWKSDGTSAGTALIRDINATPPPFTFFVIDEDTHIANGTAGDDHFVITQFGDFTIVSRDGKNEPLRLDDASLVILADAGNDTVDASAMGRGIVIHGGDGNDTLIGGSAADKIAGENGNDSVVGNLGKDHLAGGEGNDRIFGGGGRDHISGGSSRDWLYGQGGADIIAGEGGNDHLHAGGGFGDNVLRGGAGDDLLIALNSLVDQLFGDRGRDIAIADQNDLLVGIETTA